MRILIPFSFLQAVTPPPISYLLNENFEGTGMPANWFNNGSDPDFSSSPLEGLQSCRIPSGSYIVSPPSPNDFNESEVYIKFRFRISDLPSTFSHILTLYDNSFGAVLECVVFNTGQLVVSSVDGEQNGPVNLVSAGVSYDIRLHFKKATNVSLGFNLAGSPVPTSGNGFVSHNFATSSNNASLFTFLPENGIANLDVDLIQVSTSFIP